MEQRLKELKDQVADQVASVADTASSLSQANASLRALKQLNGSSNPDYKTNLSERQEEVNSQREDLNLQFETNLLKELQNALSLLENTVPTHASNSAPSSGPANPSNTTKFKKVEGLPKFTPDVTQLSTFFKATESILPSTCTPKHFWPNHLVSQSTKLLLSGWTKKLFNQVWIEKQQKICLKKHTTKVRIQEKALVMS